MSFVNVVPTKLSKKNAIVNLRSGPHGITTCGAVGDDLKDQGEGELR
jgi:hypothetical protein